MSKFFRDFLNIGFKPAPERRIPERKFDICLHIIQLIARIIAFPFKTIPVQATVCREESERIGKIHLSFRGRRRFF